MIGVALQERRVIASPIEPLKFLSVDLENQASFVSDPLFELQAIEEIRNCVVFECDRTSLEDRFCRGDDAVACWSLVESEVRNARLRGRVLTEFSALSVFDLLQRRIVVCRTRKCGPGKVDVSDVALGRVNARKALTYTRNLQCKSAGGTRLSSQSPDHRHHN